MPLEGICDKLQRFEHLEIPNRKATNHTDVESYNILKKLSLETKFTRKIRVRYSEHGKR